MNGASIACRLSPFPHSLIPQALALALALALYFFLPYTQVCCAHPVKDSCRQVKSIRRVRTFFKSFTFYPPSSYIHSNVSAPFPTSPSPSSPSYPGPQGHLIRWSLNTTTTISGG
ncbi:hypothetical protein V8E52_009607 [Russula decolorans]